MIKAVLFDLDDTLYDFQTLHKAAMVLLQEKCCRVLNITEMDFLLAFDWAREETKKYLPDVAAGHNRLLYFQKTLEYLGRNPISFALEMDGIYWGYILKHMRLNSGVLDVLDYCRKAGIKIGLGTDQTAHLQHRKLRKLGVGSYIDAIVTSEEAGKEKPDPKLFQMLLKKLNVLAKETIFVGDSLQRDIIGAERAGLYSCWYTLKKQEGYRCIEDIKELVSIIEYENL